LSERPRLVLKMQEAQEYFSKIVTLIKGVLLNLKMHFYCICSCSCTSNGKQIM